MSLVTAGRIIKLGFTNYLRNRGLSMSGTLILWLTLFIVMVFFYLNSVLSTAAQEVRNRIDLVVTFDDIVSQEQVDRLQKTLAARPETKEVRFISKEEAIIRFQNLPGISDKTKQLVTPENNPLPRSLEIKTASPDQLEQINTLLSASPWKEIIAKNTYVVNKDTIQKLSRFERGVTTAGLALSFVFIAISLVVVINTIRLAIFARREEIEIMRLVGANNLFITMPFVIEGLLYGVVATLLAVLSVYVIVERTSPSLNRYLSDVDFNVTQFFMDRLPLVSVLALVVGLTVAVFASLISIQRYLKR